MYKLYICEEDALDVCLVSKYRLKVLTVIRLGRILTMLYEVCGVWDGVLTSMIVF